MVINPEQFAANPDKLSAQIHRRAEIRRLADVNRAVSATACNSSFTRLTQP
jgi:hypothetical protein